VTTTPDVPHRFELTVEVPGTPEQVWAAVATANGISAWMIPTTLEEREGGHLAFHMGETSSEGEVTGWDPPRRFAYVEPDWNALAGKPDSPVSPMATEFLVEANAGGTCTVRVVTSAFGTGADWEEEFWDQMDKAWRPTFDILRMYLAHFPGQQVTTMGAEQAVELPPAELAAAMRGAFGITEVGQAVEGRGVHAVVEQLTDRIVVLRLTDPVPGFLTLMANTNDDRTWAFLSGQLFSADAAAWVEREQPAWQAWLQELAGVKA
jgi:uncharacterized protein YndB with AHSA1/START domain